MCGIAAIINKRNLTKNPIKALKNMSRLVSHRGPDQAGYLEYNNILLSHVRLPVMDPRNLGRQPMSNDNKIYIIFNGEIFNFKEIRVKLIKLGYKFISDSDTEVALNAYKEWGIKSFDQFNGDWVICILDKDEMIDPIKLNIVSRLGGNWYGKTTQESIYKIAKPISKIGMGFDNLPEEIKKSKFLTGNELAILASIESIPRKEKFEIRENKNLKEKHILAKEFLSQGKMEDAWQILL